MSNTRKGFDVDNDTPSDGRRKPQTAFGPLCFDQTAELTFGEAAAIVWAARDLYLAAESPDERGSAVCYAEALPALRDALREGRLI